jgi:hypothetical protein
MDWIMIVFSAVAGLAQDLEIPTVVRPAATQRYDVIDVPLDARGQACLTIGTTESLHPQNGANVLRGMRTLRGASSGPVVAVEGQHLFVIGDSPATAPLDVLMLVFSATGFRNCANGGWIFQPSSTLLFLATNGI